MWERRLGRRRKEEASGNVTNRKIIHMSAVQGCPSLRLLQSLRSLTSYVSFMHQNATLLSGTSQDEGT